MPSPKNTKVKACPPCKDGYGAHWHAVGWLAAIALVISTSTMTLSASAQGRTAITPTVLMRGINEIKTQLTRLEGKIDRIQAQVVPAPAPTPTATSVETAVPTKALTNTTTEPLTDVTKCRLTCEDEYNACIKTATTDKAAYMACSTTYEACFVRCGQ